MNSSVAPKLFLTTFRYPYGKGEQFVGNELPYLARSFSTIEIQPVQGGEGIRDVPSNVVVHKPVVWNRLDKIKIVARRLVGSRVLYEVLQLVRVARIESGGLSLKVLIGIITRCCLKKELEETPFAKLAIGSVGPKLSYSYWGSAPADLSGMLRQSGVPTCARFHRTDLYREVFDENGRLVERKFQPWHHAFSDRFHRLVFISQHGLEYFKNTWGDAGNQSKFYVSRLGTTDAGITPPKGEADLLVVVSCSRIEPIKRVHLIAELVIALSARHNVVWHHFGAGDSSAVSKLVGEADCPRLRCHLHGFVENVDVRRFYRTNHVDLFVNLSASEGIPVSIMEAISANIPVLATAVDGTPEAVVEGVSGILCAPEDALDPEVLVQKAEEVIFPRKGLTPRLLWEQRFCAERNYQEFCDSLVELARS